MRLQSKYELLILDYGGTYSFEYDISSFDKIMLNSFGKIPKPNEKLAINKASHLFAAGNVTTEEYVKQVANIINVPAPKSQTFEQATISVTHDPSDSMRRLVASTRSRGIKVALLSNMYEFEVIKTRPSGRYDGFDLTTFSTEAKLTKSDPIFFKQVLDHFGVAADRTLFVDDIIEYVNVAQTLNIHTLHASKKTIHSAQQLAEAITTELLD